MPVREAANRAGPPRTIRSSRAAGPAPPPAGRPEVRVSCSGDQRSQPIPRRCWPPRRMETHRTEPVQGASREALQWSHGVALREALERVPVLHLRVHLLVGGAAGGRLAAKTRSARCGNLHPGGSPIGLSWHETIGHPAGRSRLGSALGETKVRFRHRLPPASSTRRCTSSRSRRSPDVRWRAPRPVCRCRWSS